MPFLGDMLVPWRVISQNHKQGAESFSSFTCLFLFQRREGGTKSTRDHNFIRSMYNPFVMNQANSVFPWAMRRVRCFSSRLGWVSSHQVNESKEKKQIWLEQMLVQSLPLLTPQRPILHVEINRKSHRNTVHENPPCHPPGKP